MAHKHTLLNTPTQIKKNFFKDVVSLCSCPMDVLQLCGPGDPGTHIDLPASRVLEWKVCTTMHTSTLTCLLSLRQGCAFCFSPAKKAKCSQARGEPGGHSSLNHTRLFPPAVSAPVVMKVSRERASSKNGMKKKLQHIHFSQLGMLEMSAYTHLL